MRLIVDKNLVGRVVVLLPQASAISKQKELASQAFEVTVTRVSRTKISMERPSGVMLRDYAFSQKGYVCVRNNYNYSYLLFESWDALAQYLQAKDVQGEFQGPSENISDE